jgi:uncharacterized protein YkwD
MTVPLLLLLLTFEASAGVERGVIGATNLERQRLGLRALKEDARLDAAARKHSEDMLARGKLTHASKQKGLETPARRADAEGVRWRKVAENVAFYEGYRPSGAQVVDDWMNSPPHRVNIVDPDFRLLGVATACGGAKCYVTQMFAVEAAPIEELR